MLAHLAGRLAVSVAALTGEDPAGAEHRCQRGAPEAAAPRWCITVRVRVQPLTSPGGLSGSGDVAGHLDLPERTVDVQAGDLAGALSQLIRALA